MVRGFFNADRLTVSGTRLAHLRDFLTYIARHLGSSRDQDKLLDVRDSITKDRFPEDAFNADGNKEKDPQFLSDAEIAAACREGSDRTALVIQVLFETGCRISELQALTPSDVDFDQEDVGAAVRIDKKQTRKGETELPKSDAGNRTVELTVETAARLEEWIESNQVGGTERILPHSDTTYRNNVKDAFTDAGSWINDGPDADTYKVNEGQSFVNCHWLRHNRNTRIKKEHGPVAAQQYMGHENTDMTDHYTEFDPDEVQGIVGGNRLR